MITLRHAQDRGHANFGWLNSHHSFSFGNYYDPQHMGFSHLRVINDDSVSPDAGFETHGHKDMEIISLVLEGKMAHKDSAGNIKELPVGEYQLMSAGKGIFHSEFNASKTDPLKFLQIWIQPNLLGGEPSYQQKAFSETEGFTTIITSDGKNDTLQVKQDMQLIQLILQSETEATWKADKNHYYYVHVIEGELSLNNAVIVKAGDGAKIEDQATIHFEKNGKQRIKVLLFDLS